MGFHYFTRSFVGMPSVVQLKCLQPDQLCMVQFRPFSSGPPTEEEVKETLLYVLKSFDKVNPEQVCKKICVSVFKYFRSLICR